MKMNESLSKALEACSEIALTVLINDLRADAEVNTDYARSVGGAETRKAFQQVVHAQVELAVYLEQVLERRLKTAQHALTGE